MKILVPVKRVLDYNLKPRVKADGSGVDLANVKLSMNPFDEIAVEEADAPRRKRASRPRSSPSRSARPRRRRRCAPRWPWAPTARSWSCMTAWPSRSPSPSCCKAIADEEQPGLVILGKQAIDDDSNQTGQMLAALLGWPQGTFASKVDVAGDKVSCDPRSRRRPRDGGAQAPGDRAPPTCASTSRATPRCPTS